MSQDDRQRAQEQSFCALSLSGLVVLVTLFGLFCSGCHRVGQSKTARVQARQERRLENKRIIPEGQSAVAKVKLEGAPSATIRHRLLDGIHTQASSSFFWTRRYEVYDETALEKDLVRIEREMRRRGYYEAKVVAARVIREKEEHGKKPPKVLVEIRITPGKPVIIRRLETEGLAELSFDAAEAAIFDSRLRIGQLFDEDEYQAAKTDLLESLSNRGYAFAQVTTKAKVDIAAHSAEVVLSAQPGPRAHLGKISVMGLKRLSERAVRRVLDLKEGDLYSHREIRAARAALFDLGVFSRVEVLPRLDNPESATVPVVVRLKEAALRDVTLGGGLRLDTLRLATVGQASWTHRNFLGGLRKLTVSTRPGLTFFPTSIDYFHAPTNVFAENFASVRLEQPAFVEARTRGFVEGGYNIYPLLYPLPEDTNPKDERVIGYHEITTSFGASRNFFGRLLYTSLSFNWQANFPFLYQGSDNNTDLIEVQVTYPELITDIDLRDDPLQPTSGVYFSNSLQVALPIHKQDPTDVRIHPEVRTFVPLDNRHRLVLATRVGVGMVFPQNYGDALASANTSIDTTNDEVTRDQQRLVFRAFYSGGPSSNRGYPYRRVGPQGAIGFLLPANVDCNGPVNEIDASCIRPLGGFTMWEASTELRFHAFEKWNFVGFIDASDVSTHVASITFLKPHISIGPGVRYLSPVGPIRVDVGWRVPGLQKFANVPSEPPDVSDVPPYYDPNRNTAATWDNQPWWQRFTLNILIGEDF